VVQWFAPNDMTTAEYLSKRLGNRTVPNISTTKGNWWAKLTAGFGPSKTQSEIGVPLQSPQDLIAMDSNLPEGTRFEYDPDRSMPDINGQILNVSGIEFPVQCLRVPYYSFMYTIAREFRHKAKWKDCQGFKNKDGKDNFDKDPFHSATE
jgi:hypothetical protein